MTSSMRPRPYKAAGKWSQDMVRLGRMVALAAICFPALWAQPVAASTILRKSLSDLVKSAELVFEGTVTSRMVIPGGPGTLPRTCVTFNVTDVIAGQNPGPSLQLCFMGGDIDGEQTVVTDMHYPLVGEHGIYIAESIHRALVNPIAGWDQGRFLVEPDPASGIAKILTARRHPVLGMAAEAAQPTAGTAFLPAEGTAAGVMLGDGPDMKGAMDREAFKAWLKAAR